MTTVSSRYQSYSSSANGGNNGRRLSTAPFTNNSPVNGRHLSVVSQPLRPLSRSDDHFTELIELALQTAQNAVLLDHQRNGAAALDGYSQCCAILAEVIQRETDADEITRIRQIHDTYTVRMHVLSGELQLDPNHVQRQMPPLPTQADIQEFEDEEDEEEILASFRQIRTSNHDPIVSKQPNQRYTEVRPLDIQTSRPPLHRSTSSRDSTRGPPSARKSTHDRSTSFSRTHSQQDSLGSLEQIPSTPATASFRPLSSRDTMLPEMIDEEEMDDAAFLERITRGFTSDEEFLEDEATRPSTSSTTSSGHRQSHPKNNLSQSFVFDQIPPMARTESEDFLVPSPQSATATPRPPPSPTRPQHNRARNTSSPLPTSGMTTPRPSSAKKNLSISGAQPMYKSLSANNAIPNPDEVIVPGNAETAPKIKKRPHLIRVVSESTMRANYGSQRFSTFDNLSPGSPPSTGGSLLTPGTTTSSGFLTDSPSANFLQNRDGAGAAEDPPEDPYLRPYWLMRALALSMKNQKGAYLNSQLFVPQGVWMLKNVKLKATDEKITCFSAMTMAVRQVLDIDYGNSSILLQEVGNLEGTMDIVQQNLLRKMDGKINGTNGTNGDGRQMTRKMSQTTLLGGWGKRLRSKSSVSQTIISPNTPSGKEIGPDSAYPNAILALFECALVLEQKFDTLEPEDMPIKTQLRLDASRRRIAEFFANVVIRFVLQDLQMLMSKYVKRANEWMMS